MIQIVMKPDKAPVVNHESLYIALFNGHDLGLRVRALRASHAEAKLMETLEKSVNDKKDNGVLTIDFNLEEWRKGKDRKDAKDDKTADSDDGANGVA